MQLQRPKSLKIKIIKEHQSPTSLQKVLRVYNSKKSALLIINNKANKNNSQKQYLNLSKQKTKRKQKNKKNITAIFQQTQQNQKHQNKKHLQIQYIKAIEDLYKEMINKCQRSYLDNKLNKILPEEVVYFLGSALKKVGLQKLQSSYLQFIDQCIKVFRKSTYNDISQFLYILRKNSTDQIQKTKILNQKPLQQKRIEVNMQKNQTQQIKKQKIKTNGVIINNSSVPTKQKQSICIKNPIQNIQIQNFSLNTPIKQSNGQPMLQNKLCISKNTDNKMDEKFLKILPISSSVQSKKIQQTPSLKNRTQNSKISICTPFQKIDQLTKSIQKCLKQSKNEKNITKITQPDVQKNIQRQQGLNNLQNQTYSYPFYPNSTYSINQKKSSNNYLTMHLQQKYGYISKNINPSQHKTANSSIQKYSMAKSANNWYTQNKTIQMVGNKNYGRQWDNDDRIDRLTEKLQKHIDRNASKIQKSQQVRNLQ